MTAPESLTGKYPLATKSGIEALSNILLASHVWRELTKPQRELLLSTVAGCPVKARRDVVRRLAVQGLLADWSGVDPDRVPEATGAGRFVVRWRTP